MRKLLFMAITSCFTAAAFSQADLALNQRLANFMIATSGIDLEKILDYTYPKLFTIAPRAQLAEVLKKTFNNVQMTLKLDSLRTDSIYPVFKMQEGSYAKIRYSMRMVMHFKSGEIDSSRKKEADEFMLSSLQSKYGKEKVSMDSTGNIMIHQTALMMAVRDNYAKEWCFVNLKDGIPLSAACLLKKSLIN